MELEVLKKKISSFRVGGNRLRITEDSMYMEILHAWEQWTGSSKDFFKGIGVSKAGLAGIIGKAKRMKRDGHFPVSEFKEIKIAEPTSYERTINNGPCQSVEILWDGGKLIRFPDVELLIDFLKKVS